MPCLCTFHCPAQTTPQAGVQGQKGGSWHGKWGDLACRTRGTSQARDKGIIREVSESLKGQAGMWKTVRGGGEGCPTMHN